MNVGHTEVSIELDADDLAHLLKTGSTQVSDTESDVNAVVRCTDSATVNVVVNGDSEE